MTQAFVAQLVERSHGKGKVSGSSPGVGNACFTRAEPRLFAFHLKKQGKKDDFMMRQLCITLKAFEPNVLTKVSHTLHTVCEHLQNENNPFFVFKRVGLPTLKKYFTVLRSPHVHKKSREQFVMHQYKTRLCMTTCLRGKQEMLQTRSSTAKHFGRFPEKKHVFEKTHFMHVQEDKQSTLKTAHNSFSEHLSKSFSKNALLKQRTFFACKHLSLSGVQIKQVIHYSSPLWSGGVS